MRPSWRVSVKIGMCAAMIDEHREQRRAADLDRRLEDDVLAAVLVQHLVAVGRFRELANTFSTTITAPSTMMPKSIAPTTAGWPGCRSR